MPDDALPTPDRVLVVAAHPDDIEFGAAGTVARWVSEGATVRYLLVTRGDKGSDDPDVDVAELTQTRMAEQRAAAAELGVAGVDFLDEPDGQVEPSLTLRERITHAIRSFRPEIVMSHDPTVLFVNNEWVNHPDHRAVGQTAVDAVFPTARDPLNFREHLDAGLEPWKVAELYLWSTNEANQLVDIGGTIERKVAALAHHASQFRDFESVARWVRRRSEELGERAGYRAAEGFRRVTLAR
ncbi:MAG TPA: PIG-L deacetylase family protein [Candidatus Limnocylindria bacterium]|jgi:LmbE family N-acetylglucosaminyl deacetylase|nr:PIG-L deacetylase family protein [Candidatus Limnocylindria bacterium]